MVSQLSLLTWAFDSGMFIKKRLFDSSSAQKEPTHFKQREQVGETYEGSGKLQHRS